MAGEHGSDGLTPLEHLGRECCEAAWLVTETVLTQAPQPAWWPYRWVRLRGDASTAFALEVSDAEENPWP